MNVTKNRRTVIIAIAGLAAVVTITALILSRSNGNGGNETKRVDAGAKTAKRTDAGTDAAAPVVAVKPPKIDIGPPDFGPTGPLRIYINAYGDPDDKEAMQELVRWFTHKYPNIAVEPKYFNDKDYEVWLESFENGSLTKEELPDVFTWVAGYRLRQAIKKKLLAKVTDGLWTKPELQDNMGTIKNAVTIEKQQYGIPYEVEYWNMYYNKKLFRKFGLRQPDLDTPPVTWEEFQDFCTTIKGHKTIKGIAPITIGTKELFHAVVWFSYLNLDHNNGREFHEQLMDGDARYSDSRVRSILNIWWNGLIAPECFAEEHASRDSRQALEMFSDNQAAMILERTSSAAQFATAERQDEFGVFEFPRKDLARAVGALVLTRTLHVPNEAINQDNARFFLAFAARADMQGTLAEKLSSVPAYRTAYVPHRALLRESAKLLHRAPYVQQHYRYDAPLGMLVSGMTTLTSFMQPPRKDDRKMLKKLDEVQRVAYRDAVK